MLNVQNVTVSYGLDTVLSDISFSLSPGKVLAIVGPNGSGKSTLLKAMLGLKKFSGLISYDNLSPTQARNDYKISYLSQQHTLNNQLPLTVYDIVSQAFKGKKSWMETLNQEEINTIDHVLEKVQLLDKKNTLFSNLSGGQRQRALLALALANNVSYIFLDEPTNALDFKSIQIIYQIIDELRNKNIGVIIVSHDINAIITIADEVMILMKNVKFFGEPNNIPKEVLHSTFGVHIQVTSKDPDCAFCDFKTDKI